MTEATPSISLQGGQRHEVARRRITSFSKRFGRAHLYLAYHAAFPMALTSDLLYRLWANFSRDIHGKPLNIPWIAVADLLLSSLCDEVGHDLYEMSVAVRTELLSDLKINPNFGGQRIRELSDFLLAYVQQRLDSPSHDIRSVAQAQQWTALAYTSPGDAARKMALALRSILEQNDREEQIRLASLVEIFTEQLSGFTPLLIYARGIVHFASGEMEDAVAQFNKLVGGKKVAEVEGVKLRVPAKAQQVMMGTKGAKLRVPAKVQQVMMGTKGSIQIEGRNNVAAQIIRTILVNFKPEIKKKVKNALDTYINTLLTDKNRIPLEFILAMEERIKYDIVPLPAVFTQLDVIYRLALLHGSFSENDNEYGDNREEGSSENKPIAAVQAVAENRHIVIVGDPGAGKTTLINYLCVIMALLLQGDKDAEERLKRDSNGTWKANETLFPISIRLKDFGRSEQFRNGEASASTLAGYIVDRVVAEHRQTDVDGSIRSRILELLKRGGALIVMDGLDDLPGEAYEADTVGRPDERDNQQYFKKTARAKMRLQRILNSFINHPEYGRCRVVVTSRSYAYRTNSEWRLGAQFAEAHLRDFEPKQIQEYIRFWYIQIANRIAKQNQSESDLLRWDADYKMIEAAVSSFWQALEKNKYMLELARSPLILCFIISRYGTDRHVKSLPSVSKVLLCGEIVRMLTKYWSRHQLEFDDPNAPATLVDALGLQNDDQLELLLSVVAFEAHKGMEDAKGTSSAIITNDTLRRAWEKIGGIFNVGSVRKEVWMQLRDRTGILLPYRTDDDGMEYFAFAHPSFQEWLAAKAIMSRSPKILPIEYWPKEYRQDGVPLNVSDLVAGLVQIDPVRWREVIVLILESMIYTEPNTTWQIIGRLVAEPIPEIPEDNRWYGAFLVGCFLERNKDIINDTGRSEPEAVRNWLVRSLQCQAMSIEERVEVGRVLSVLGDERVQLNAESMSRFNEKTWSLDHANTIDNLWVQVPDTIVMVGSSPRDTEGQRRERPEERRPANCAREVKEFYISRYHVTSDMFQCFIQDGYHIDHCWSWSSSSLQWHESHPLPEQSNQMHLGNAPRRMVSWYEAVAFCRWLTLINPFNLEVFLPSESEWLAAACSDLNGKFQDTVYVWGDSFEGQPAKLTCYGNIRRLRLETVCSVGIFQPNRLGIFDMSGNVAEWTRSIWKSDLALTESNELDNLPRMHRAVRGCSYRDIDADIRVGRRRGLPPEQRFPYVGFRIAARLRN